MDQQAFSNVPASPQPHPAHPPGLVAVRERTLRQFVAPSPQPGAAIPANPPTVPVDGASQGLPTPPAPAPARGLRDVRTVAALPRLLDYRIAVIPLVTHQRPRLLPLPATLRRRRLPGPRVTAPEMALRFVQCLRQRLRVPPAPWLDRDRRYRSALQIHRVLRLVRHPRPTILQPTDASLRINRMRPLAVRQLLPAFAVVARHLFNCRSLDPRLLHQRPHILPVSLAAVPTDDLPHRSVRHQGRRVHAKRFPSQKARSSHPFHNPAEHLRVRLLTHPTTRPRNRRMIRTAVRRPVSQKPQQAARVIHPPRNQPFRVQTLEIPDQQTTEIPPRRKPRTTVPRVVTLATLLHELVKTAPSQNLVQTLVERIPLAPRQRLGSDPQRLLPRAAASHSHAEILRSPAVRLNSARQSFTTGC